MPSSSRPSALAGSEYTRIKITPNPTPSPVGSRSRVFALPWAIAYSLSPKKPSGAPMQIPSVRDSQASRSDWRM
eukprot:7787110-Alexandrium_andersonii.AAC.1